MPAHDHAHDHAHPGHAHHHHDRPREAPGLASAMLLSAPARLAAALVPVAALWALVGWAMN